jgi:hypothetical protein
VYVDIHFFGRNIQKEEEARKVLASPGLPHCAIEGGHHGPIPQESTIDESEYPPTATLFAVSHKPPDPLPSGPLPRELHQLSTRRSAEQLTDSTPCRLEIIPGR